MHSDLAGTNLQPQNSVMQLQEMWLDVCVSAFVNTLLSFNEGLDRIQSGAPVSVIDCHINHNNSYIQI